MGEGGGGWVRSDGCSGRGGIRVGNAEVRVPDSGIGLFIGKEDIQDSVETVVLQK